ncbi:MAG: MDR family MFS transporter [Acidimicrobiales bacterium]
MNQKIAVSVVFVAAMFMTIMDATIVNVALPTLGRQFGVRPDAVDTVAIAFLVSLAVFIPASGWIGDRLGGRTTLLGAIVIFTGASALCGVATSLGQLVVFRVLQGAGGGMMAPVGLAMLFRTFPPAERVRASSILTVPTALAPALGPVLGGVLVTDLSWRWVFYVNVPIGVAALAFGVAFLEDRRQESPGRFDVAGFGLAGIGLGLLMYGVSEGPVQGWHHPVIWATVAAGSLLLGALVAVELRIRAPMIDLRLFGDRLFRSSNGVLVLGSVAFLGVLFLAALFFQDGLGLSALQSGLSTFPEALGVMAGAQVVTRRLYPALGPRRVMAGGLLVVGGSIALMALVGSSGDLWWMRLLMLSTGLGMSAVFIPAQAAAFATISPAATGRASTLFNALRQLGGAAGVALLTTVVAAVGPTREVNGRVAADLSSYHLAFLAAAAVAGCGALVALTVPDADAAETMVRRRDKGGEAPQPALTT